MYVPLDCTGVHDQAGELLEHLWQQDVGDGERPDAGRLEDSQHSAPR